MGCFEDFMEFKESVDSIIKNRRGHREGAKGQFDTDKAKREALSLTLES